jgi:hypothetical protein
MTDDLEKELSELENKGEGWVHGMSDRNVRPAIILLTKAVLRLDKTSTQLAKVYIWLSAVLLVVGVLQAAIMLLHR